MVDHAMPIPKNGDSPIERVRSWSSISSFSLKTIFRGGKQCVSSSEKDQEAEGSWDHPEIFTATASATSTSDAFIITHEDVANSEVDLTREDSTHEDLAHAEDEAESALSDCGGAPSEMLLAFASVQSWGRSDNEFGTKHYGAGYQTAQVGSR
ncbi:hypothetical protein T484DRAFT_1746807 [Baffinella frigidus]|nr:hypothetical protein T484DRAFT_1746807 [Cryptophyta sp. CCMP2293]